MYVFFERITVDSLPHLPSRHEFVVYIVCVRVLDGVTLAYTCARICNKRTHNLATRSKEGFQCFSCNSSHDVNVLLVRWKKRGRKNKRREWKGTTFKVSCMMMAHVSGELVLREVTPI